MAQEEDTVWVLEVIGLWACGTREALNRVWLKPSNSVLALRGIRLATGLIGRH